MRFSNDDYLKAFPREDRINETISEDNPGDVLNPNEDPGESDPEGGENNGNE